MGDNINYMGITYQKYYENLIFIDHLFRKFLFFKK